MEKTKVTTVQEYLEQLPPERRAVVEAVRDVIVRNLPAGYVECIGYGMLSYVVPLERFPKTYNKQPLGYVCLAAQKNYFALHLRCVYMCEPRRAWLEEEFRKAGKKLDMGKGCLRFKKVEDLPLEAIGQLVASTPMEGYIAQYEESRKR